jgi:hypothetical protein
LFPVDRVRGDFENPASYEDDHALNTGDGEPYSYKEHVILDSRKDIELSVNLS